MHKVLFAATALLLASAATASTSYNLTSIGGTWSWGNTQWNNDEVQGYVDNVLDVGTVNALLHSPYVYSPPTTVPGNAIYTWAPDGGSSGTLTFSVNGGTATTLNFLTIRSSRSYGSGTQILLDVSTDGGSNWSNVLSSTTGALGWIDVGTGGTETQILSLSFGGVSGNAFRFSADGSQINLHSLAVNGPLGGVPEPASWAMLIAGFGLTGAALRRRRTTVAA